MVNNSLFSSKSCEWSTPKDLFDKLDQHFKFTLDPCADVNNAKCNKYFTKKEDGLSQSWQNERVFCNPPYGREIGSWIRKAFDEVMFNDCAVVVLLIPARTDTFWFHNYLYKVADLYFLQGRLSFNDFGRAPFPSMIAVLRRKDNVHV